MERSRRARHRASRSAPVRFLRGRAGVAGRDRRLQGVGAAPAKPLCASESRETMPDEDAIPAGAVLVEEQDRLAAGPVRAATPAAPRAPAAHGLRGSAGAKDP